MVWSNLPIAQQNWTWDSPETASDGVQRIAAESHAMNKRVTPARVMMITILKMWFGRRLRGGFQARDLCRLRGVWIGRWLVQISDAERKDDGNKIRDEKSAGPPAIDAPV